MTDGTAQLVDVHAHYGPTGPAVRELLAHARVSGEYAGPEMQWDPELAIDFMDTHGIQLQLLSFPMPMPAKQVRMFNEYGASLVSKYPDRFGLLASIPMDDPESAAIEIEYAATDLHADGFILVTNYDGRYLGDELFEPAFAALDRHHATLFVHPVVPAGFDLTGCGLPGPLIEFPMDTARTIVNAIWAGVLIRHPNLHFVLAHAGGVLPMLAPRILDLAPAGWVPDPASGPEIEAVAAQLRSLYADTAIAGTPGSLEPLLRMIGSDHVLFGTDFPAAPMASIDSNIKALRDSEPFGGDALAAITGNTRTLFPSVHSRLSA